jgi:hypothetical protein
MIKHHSNRYDNLREYKREMGTSGPAKKRSRKIILPSGDPQCSTCGYRKSSHAATGEAREWSIKNGMCETFNV